VLQSLQLRPLKAQLDAESGVYQARLQHEQVKTMPRRVVIKAGGSGWVVLWRFVNAGAEARARHTEQQPAPDAAVPAPGVIG
jgi:hypothetical protein